jgi:hypothetical protein
MSGMAVVPLALLGVVLMLAAVRGQALMGTLPASA